MIKSSVLSFVMVLGFKTLCHGQDLNFSLPQDKELPLNARGMLLVGIPIYSYLQESNSPEVALTEMYFLSRLPISQKVNLLLGPKLDIYRMGRSGEVEYGILFSSGIEYNPTNDSYINLLYNYRTNDLSNEVYHYNTFDKSSFNFGAGFKF